MTLEEQNVTEMTDCELTETAEHTDEPVDETETAATEETTAAPSEDTVEVSEIDYGVIFVRDLAKLDDLFKRSELIYLAHGLNSHADVGVAVDLKIAVKRVRRERHSLLARYLCGAACVDNDGVRCQKLGGVERAADVVDALKSLFGVYARKRDEIWGVEGHEHSVLACRVAYLFERCVACGKSVACLVFVCVKSLLIYPKRCLDG